MWGVACGALKESQWPHQRPLITDRHNKYNTSGEAWTIARVTTKAWPERESGEGVSRCCWGDGAHRLAQCKVATNLQFVKSRVTVKWGLLVTFLNVLPGHRAVYIGVHVPFSKESRRRHRHRGHKHHHRRRKDKDSDREDGRESPSYGKRSGKFFPGKFSTNALRFFPGNFIFK